MGQTWVADLRVLTEELSGNLNFFKRLLPEVPTKYDVAYSKPVQEPENMMVKVPGRFS